MKTSAKIIISLALGVLVLTPLFCQSQSNDVEKTLIYSYVQSEDPALQSKAIDIMKARRKRQGKLDDDLEKLLIAMATTSIRKEEFEAGIHIRANQDIQLKSIMFLGEIGGQPALDAMSDLLDKSTNYTILYETVNSSADIKADDYKAFLLSLAKAMKNQHYTKLDNAFAYASLYTVNNLLEKQNVLLTPEMIKIVLLYSESAYIQKVRDFAQQVLMKY